MVQTKAHDLINLHKVDEAEDNFRYPLFWPVLMFRVADNDLKVVMDLHVALFVSKLINVVDRLLSGWGCLQTFPGMLFLSLVGCIILLRFYEVFELFFY